VEASDHLELVMEPDLSVVVVRRRGWEAGDYAAWSDRALRDGRAFVVPSTWRGETVLRLCIVNPRTTVAAVAGVLESLR
jgi:glutamate/tyrosine decarboxylase-like PLP-dependent enzyme